MSWILYEEYAEPNYLVWIHRIQNFALGWQDILPDTFDTAIIVQDKHLEFHLEKEKFKKKGEKLFDRIYKDPEWFHKLHWEGKIYADRLFDFSSYLKAVDYTRLADWELADYIGEFLKYYHKSHDHGVLLSVLEFHHELLTKYLLGYLGAIKPKRANKLSSSQIFTILTSSTHENYTRQSRLSELKILSKIYSDKNLYSLFLNTKHEEIFPLISKTDNELSEIINSHYQSFCWLPYGTDGPAWGTSQLIKSFKNSIQNKENPQLLIEQIKNEYLEIREQQKKLYSELEINERHKRLFQIAQDSVYLKGLRKDVTSYAFYCAQALLREAAKRLDLSLPQLRMLLPSELDSALREKRFDPDELNSRTHLSAYVILKGKEYLLSGHKAREFVNNIHSEEIVDERINELHGTCAVAGKARGIVKIIRSPRDISKMNNGDILVSYVTDVNLEPAMLKAAAIVTDSGGMTSHAAIFAREFGITCLVGTKIATKILSDGFEVEVDSERGRVKILKK